MATSGVGGTSSSSSSTTAPTVDRDKVGVAGLTSDSFLKLLITQLQNQDPTAPMSNEELLNQLSQMRTLQSNIELSDMLKTQANNQQVTAGAAFLGKIVTGTSADGSEVTGVADRVLLKGGSTFVGIGNDEVQVSKITGVSIPPAE